jgi:hypothetical protein
LLFTLVSGLSDEAVVYHWGGMPLSSLHFEEADRQPDCENSGERIGILASQGLTSLDVRAGQSIERSPLLTEKGLCLNA